jgi:hypothetical protein
MAVSKGFTFSAQDQITADWGKAFAHPARVLMLRRLIEYGAMSYSAMTGGMPIARGPIADHVDKLKRANLILPVLLANNLGGYTLNESIFRAGAQEMDEVFSVTNFLTPREKETRLEKNVGDGEWVRDFEMEHFMGLDGV